MDRLRRRDLAIPRQGGQCRLVVRAMTHGEAPSYVGATEVPEAILLRADWIFMDERVCPAAIHPSRCKSFPPLRRCGVHSP